MLRKIQFAGIMAVVLMCAAVGGWELAQLLDVPFVFAQSGPDLTAPVCGLNNDSTNHIPSGAAITTVNGTTSYSWHDFVENVPAVGGTWVDPLYGCSSMVLTNVITANAGQVHNYAISPAIDRGDCYILALDANAGLSSQYIIAAPTSKCSGGFGTGSQTVISSAQMPGRTSHNEFIWDYFTQGKFWFANANTIRSCTITGIGTTSCSTAHTFSEYSGSGCNFMDYATMNQNGFINVICQNTAGSTMDIFVYDSVHDVKSSVYTTTCTGTPVGSNQPGCIHKMAGPAPGNGILVQFNGNSCGNETGNHWFAYPTPASPMPQVECLTDHVDTMADLNTNDVALYEDFQDNPGPWAPCSNGFRPTLTKLPLSGNPTCMFDNTVEYGWDISTRDYPLRPWGLYSVQGSQGSIGASENCDEALTGTTATVAAAPTGAVRVSGVTTITATAALNASFVTGSYVKVAGVTDSTFNTTINVKITVTGSTTFTYANPGSDATSGSGTVTLGSYVDPASGNWNPMSNELILTRVDANDNFTKIWRLGLTHERGKCGGNTFYSDPRAAISIDGNYVVYDTNARCGTGTCTPAVITDIVLMGGGISGGLVTPLFPSSAVLPPPVVNNPGARVAGRTRVLTRSPGNAKRLPRPGKLP